MEASISERRAHDGLHVLFHECLPATAPASDDNTSLYITNKTVCSQEPYMTAHQSAHYYDAGHRHERLCRH